MDDYGCRHLRCHRQPVADQTRCRKVTIFVKYLYKAYMEPSVPDGKYTHVLLRSL